MSSAVSSFSHLVPFLVASKPGSWDNAVQDSWACGFPSIGTLHPLNKKAIIVLVPAEKNCFKMHLLLYTDQKRNNKRAESHCLYSAVFLSLLSDLQLLPTTGWQQSEAADVKDTPVSLQFPLPV